MTSPIYNQNGFRFYQDTSGWTGLAAENANYSIGDDTHVILRIELEVTNAKASNNWSGYLYAAKNGGAYTVVDQSRADGLRAAPSSWFTDADADNNNRLTTSSLTFTGGELDSNGLLGDAIDGIDFAGQDHWEVSICLEIDTANASSGDYWDFELRDSGGAQLDSYSRRPRFTYISSGLGIDDTRHLHRISNIILAQVHKLQVDGLRHVHRMGGVEFSIPTVFTNSPAVCDFENNDLGDWDYTYTSGSVTLDVVSSPALGGVYSGRCLLSSTTVTASAYMRKLITWPNGDKVYCWWRWRCDDRGTLDDTNAMRLWTLSESSISSANRYWRCDVNPSTATITVYATDSTGNFVNTGITWTFSEDIDYEIEIMYDRSGTNAKLEMWVNNTSQGSWEGSGNCTELSAHALVLGGYHSTTTTDNWINMYYDDVMAEETRIGSDADTLAIQSIRHLHKTSDINLTQLHNIQITGLKHKHRIDGVHLTQTHNLQIDGLRHLHHIIDPILSVTNILNIANLIHSHRTDNVILTQSHNLQVSGLTHGHRIDGIDLTQTHSLQIEDLRHIHRIGGLTLSVTSTLDINDIIHQHRVNDVIVAQLHNLQVSGLRHEHRIDATNLTQAHNLQVSDLKHTHRIGDLILSVLSLLNIADLIHLHRTTGDIGLTQVHNLQIRELRHEHRLSSISNLGGLILLTINDIRHLNRLDDFSITQLHNLGINSIRHAHHIQNISLTQSHNIRVDDLRHTHHITGDILLPITYSLLVNNLRHAHNVDPLVLTQTHDLQIYNLRHTQRVSEINLTGATLLVIQGLRHIHYINPVFITQKHNLKIDGLRHLHRPNNVIVSPAILLVINNMRHGHLVDGLSIAQAHMLGINNIRHEHRVDLIWRIILACMGFSDFYTRRATWSSVLSRDTDFDDLENRLAEFDITECD